MGSVEESSLPVVLQADDLIPLNRDGAAPAKEIAVLVIHRAASSVQATNELVELKGVDLLLSSIDDLAVPVVPLGQVAILPNYRGHADDGVVTSLPMDLCKKKVWLVPGEEAGAGDWRELGWVSKDENLLAEGQ